MSRQLVGDVGNRLASALVMRHPATPNAYGRPLTFVGIDLAAQPQTTAACVLAQLEDRRFRVDKLEAGLDDFGLFGLMTEPGVRRIGIDAPVGWPLDFITALEQYRASGLWPDPVGSDDHQKQMRLRSTDRLVARVAAMTPLSVSTDKLAAVAMRCARLLSGFWSHTGEAPDRTGNGTAVEVYPAAALQLWDLSQQHHPQDPGSYKGSSAGLSAL